MQASMTEENEIKLKIGGKIFPGLVSKSTEER
jgi:hypothetical protein